jgi:hypothetical protein
MTWTPGANRPGREPLGPPAYAPPVPPSATPPRRRRTGLIAAIAAGALVLLAGGAAIAFGVTRHTKPPAAAQATPTCAVIGINGCEPTETGGSGQAQHSADPAQALPASIRQACDLNEQMRKAAANADLRDQGATITKVQTLAGNSTIFDIKFQANMLKDRYDLAVAATDDPASFAATINLFTASTELSTACLNAGWRSP